MGVRVDDVRQFVGLRVQTSNWQSVTRYSGLALVGLGIYSAIAPGVADPVWGVFLVTVGLTALRVNASTALSLFTITLGWASLLNALFGRLGIAGLLFVATAMTLGAFQAAYRQEDRGLPASPGLALASLGLGISGVATLILAFGGSLLAFLTGWQLDAYNVDVLAAAGVHQAVLALAFGVSAGLQRHRTLWPAVLGGLMSLIAIGSYLGLLLIAQG